MRLTSWCQLTAVRTSWHWNESVSRRHLVKFKCIVGPVNLVRASKGTTYIMKYRSASLNCIDFAAFSWQYMTCTMNIAAGWFSHDFLLGFFSLPFLASALASRLLPIYHPTTSLINPARNERAKNLGMSAAPAERIIAGKCIQSRENS